MKILYQEIGSNSLENNNSGLPPRKARKRGPLIAAKAADMFPSLERSQKNQSDLILKLPEISRAKNAASLNDYSLNGASLLGIAEVESRRGRDLSIHYTEERREKMRLKLEKLY